jgi:regulator of replication initiation timing
MDTDPKQRLAEIRARMAELKQERDTLRAEREQLRAALGREPRRRGEAGSD